MKVKLHIVGAGGHSKVVTDGINIKNKYSEVYLYDDNYKKIKEINNFKVISKISELNINKKDYYFVAIGDNSIRKKILENLIKKNVNIATIFHKNSIVSRYSIIGKGTYIGPNAIINSNSKIDKGCIINSGSIVEHDCVIKEYSHLAPNSCLGGGVLVNSECFIGMGSIVVPNIIIKKKSFIKAGNLVKK